MGSSDWLHKFGPPDVFHQVTLGASPPAIEYVLVFGLYRQQDCGSAYTDLPELPNRFPRPLISGAVDGVQR